MFKAMHLVMDIRLYKSIKETLCREAWLCNASSHTTQKHGNAGSGKSTTTMRHSLPCAHRTSRRSDQHWAFMIDVHCLRSLHIFVCFCIERAAHEAGLAAFCAGLHPLFPSVHWNTCAFKLCLHLPEPLEIACCDCPCCSLCFRWEFASICGQQIKRTCISWIFGTWILLLQEHSQLSSAEGRQNASQVTCSQVAWFQRNLMACEQQVNA